MTNVWRSIPLGDALEVLRNGISCKQDKSGNGDKISRIESISTAKFDPSRVGFAVLNELEKAKNRLRKGDILFSHINSPIHVGKTAIFDSDDEIFHGMNLLLMRPKPDLDPTFLNYQLLKLFESGYWVKTCKKAVNQASVNQQDIIKIPIAVPPIEEQTRIVAILDEAFACIDKAKANTEKNIQNARELFDSYVNNIFSNPGPDWETKSLGEVGSVSMCKRVYKEQTTANGDIPFYKIGTFGKEPDSFISNEIYNDFRNKYSFPQVGDVLLSAAGTIGRRVKYDGRPAYFQDSNIIWLAHDERQVLNDYLFHFYGACEWGSTKGATISRLYNDNLRQIKISFPKSSDEQRTIVQRLDSLLSETQNTAAISQRKMDTLESLRKSILQKAFSGEFSI